MRKSAFLVILVCLTIPCFAEEKESTAAALGKAAGAKIGEAAAKWLAGKLYDSSCVNVINNAAISYVCDVMRGFSGRDESEWKAKLENKLNEISGKLDNIENVQREIQTDLKRNFATMNAKVEQIAADVIATEKLVRISGLWEKYQTQFDNVDGDVNPASMIAFAKEIIANEPHSILTQLNVLMTNPPKGQSLVKYPFYEWRVQNQTLPGSLNANEVYDFAEKKFIEYRGHEQKAYAMYLWAASVLETQCQLHPADCTHPPRPLADFQADYDRYTRLQAEAFNSAVDWFLLSYAFPRANVQPNFLPATATNIYLRANLLTSAVAGDGQGLWGRVISMGNAWDGTLQVSCGGTTQTLTPVLKYTAPAGGNGMVIPGPDDNRPMDWWVSRSKNTTYDEVHFSDKWQMYHYSLPSAPLGTCTVASQLPQNAGVLPWIGAPAEMVEIDAPGAGKLRGGSFLAIQRAGGNYALVSGGNWVYSREPEKLEEGKGSRDQEYTWMIEPDHQQGPWIGVRVKGKASYMPKFSSRIRNKHRILLTQAKDVHFPEGGTVKLMYYPGYCGSLCDGDSSSIIRYDQPNYDGKLTAQASVQFLEGSIPDLPRGGGMFVQSSYDKTKDRKSADIKGPQSGLLDADPSKDYRLQYEILIDMENEGPGLDAAEYYYLVRLAPGAMYLTK
jgi:hypothetical protein